MLNNPHPWQRAASFAARFHHGQTRKDGSTPYAAHPFRVALTVRHVFGIEDSTALCAALLHDVIEDTTADYDDVVDEFGVDVADAVGALTKDMRLPQTDRESAYDAQLAVASWQTRAVKLADVYDNLCDCESRGMRRRAKKKALRAIDCAGNEPKLSGAIDEVRQLIEELAEDE